jgi:molecular chaperone DnaK (HSP70)
MIKKFNNKHPGKDLKDNDFAIAKLKRSCEEAKCVLSTMKSAQIEIPNLIDGIDFYEKLTRNDFEFLCSDILDKITEPIDKALNDANLEKEDIDNIIMVGGSSCIPAVKATLKDYFDKEPLVAVNPDEAVAHGAAIICDKSINGKLTGSSEERASDEDEGIIRLVETLPISIGIKSERNRYKKIIYSNKPLPQENSYTFTTTKDNQRYADVEIFQGEEIEIESNGSHDKLGTFRIEDLPQRPAGEIKIVVSMKVDENGLLKITGRCEEPGVEAKSLTIKIL